MPAHVSEFLRGARQSPKSHNLVIRSHLVLGHEGICRSYVFSLSSHRNGRYTRQEGNDTAGFLFHKINTHKRGF